MNLEIDRLCVEFEDKLKSGEVPRIEDYLERIGEDHRELLLTELLLLKFEYQDTTSPDAYIERFPQFEDVVRRTFASQISLQRTELKAGDKVGRYEIRELLGSGNFGWVYHGWDGELNRDVALKVPRLSESATGATAEAFCEEARSLAALQHRNILGIHDIVRDQHGWPILVLEHLQGKTLSEFDVAADEQTLGWLIQVCEGLGYAHQRGVVHRDLKPQNVFIDKDDRVVLVDFGLSLQHESKGEHTGESAGTLKYMSPEQVRGEAHWMDGRADIWSVGVILYQLLCGRLPFHGNSPEDLAEAIQGQPARPPRQFAPSVNPALEQICLKCLRKTPDDRYATATDLARDLRQTIYGQPAFSIGRLVAAVCVLAMGGLLWWSQETQDPNNPEVETETSSAEPIDYSIATFDFETNIKPWTAYSAARLKRGSDAAVGKSCLWITDRQDHEDGAVLDLTSDLQPGGYYWFSAMAKSLAEPFDLQLQLELKEPGSEYRFPNISFTTVNDQWQELAGGIEIKKRSKRAALIARSNGLAITPFALDRVCVVRLEEIPRSEQIQNGSFVTADVAFNPDNGEMSLTRVDDGDGGWFLTATDRKGEDSGFSQKFKSTAGRYYYCRARVRAAAADVELRLLIKRYREGLTPDYTGLQRHLKATSDEWRTLEEIYRVPDEAGADVQLEFGVFSSDCDKDFWADDISVVELRPVAR